MPLARPRSRCCDRFVFGRLGRGRRINEPRTGDPCADGKDRGPVAWHPGHDTTLTPANPWAWDQPAEVCHSLATLPGHRRATHAPGRHSRVVPSALYLPVPGGHAPMARTGDRRPIPWQPGHGLPLSPCDRLASAWRVCPPLLYVRVCVCNDGLAQRNETKALAALRASGG
jgi:hypothetical protein